MATSIVDTAVREPIGPRFRIHLTGVGLANLADGIMVGAVPLIAITLTRSPQEVAALSAVFWLPWLFLGIAAGVIIDRLDRRRVQLAGVLCRVVLLAGAVALAATGSLTMPLLIGITALYGVTQVFVDLAGSSIIPQIVPRSRLSAANGRIMGMEQVTNTFIGAPLGGFILILGSVWVFGSAALLGLAFLLLIGLGLRGNYRAERADVETTPSKPREVLEGLRFQFTHTVLRPMVISGSVTNLANTGFFAVFVLWAVGPGSFLGLEPQQFPLLLAVLAVGAVVGSVTTESIMRWIPEIPLLHSANIVNCLLLLVPVFTPNPLVVAGAFFVIGMTNMIGNIIRRSMSQRLVPAGMLGRVGGASGTINYGLMPLGAMLGGVAAEIWGLRPVFIGAVALMFVTNVWLSTRVRTRKVREHELP